MLFPRSFRIQHEESSRPPGCQLNSPDRAPYIQWSFEFHKSGNRIRKNPDVLIRRHAAGQLCEELDPGAELRMHDEMLYCPGASIDGYHVFSRRNDIDSVASTLPSSPLNVRNPWTAPSTKRTGTGAAPSGSVHIRLRRRRVKRQKVTDCLNTDSPSTVTLPFFAARRNPHFATSCHRNISTAQFLHLRRRV